MDHRKERDQKGPHVHSEGKSKARGRGSQKSKVKTKSKEKGQWTAVVMKSESEADIGDQQSDQKGHKGNGGNSIGKGKCHLSCVMFVANQITMFSGAGGIIQASQQSQHLILRQLQGQSFRTGVYSSSEFPQDQPTHTHTTRPNQSFSGYSSSLLKSNYITINFRVKNPATMGQFPLFFFTLAKLVDSVVTDSISITSPRLFNSEQSTSIAPCTFHVPSTICPSLPQRLQVTLGSTHWHKSSHFDSPAYSNHSAFWSVGSMWVVERSKSLGQKKCHVHHKVVMTLNPSHCRGMYRAISS